MAATIRSATPDDAAALTDLAIRSKAHWAYDDDFMARARPALEVTADYIRDWPVFVLRLDGHSLGFGGFLKIETRMFLNDLFVDPPWIRTGAGTLLWNHAIDVAREHSWASFDIESDPFAEGFYIGKGAVRIGEIRSAVNGRDLPLLRYAI